ncbi:MAG: response regulator [Anaerolineae bacterium]|nr:response regulator [Anaerolineae bacterium]
MEKKKVMIVEDSNVMRLVIRNLINTNPNLIVAKTASNGKEALDLLPSVQPDLILLDLEMPEMDGLEFLRAARLKTRAKIVVLSSIAIAGSTAATQARNLGADAVISKPSGSVSYDLEEKRGAEFWGTIHKILGIEID